MTTPRTSTGTSLAGQSLAAVWERWWAGIDGTPGEIVWDTDPGDPEADLGHFVGSLTAAA